MNETSISKRSIQKQETRRNIVQSACSILRSKPANQLKVSDVTQLVGIAHGTFYVHFQSVDELLQEIVGEINASVRADLMNIWSSIGKNGMRAVVDQMAEAFFTHIENDIEVIASLCASGNNAPLAWLSGGINAPMVETISDLILVAANSGMPEHFDSELLAHSVLGIWARLGFRYALTGGGDRRQYRYMLTEMTLAALSILPSVNVN